MVNVIDKDFYLALIKDTSRFGTYSGILFPELFYYLNRDDYDYWFFFEKGKSVLIFNKEKEYFIEKNLFLIKMETRFLERNIITINSNSSTLAFIKSCQMDFIQDTNFSENIWLHRSDADFIQEYLVPGLTEDQIIKKTWLNQFSYKINLDKLTRPIRFYILSHQDRTIYSQMAAANILNHLGIYFSLGRNNNVIVSQNQIDRTKRLLSKIKLYPFNTNPFLFFKR